MVDTSDAKSRTNWWPFLIAAALIVVVWLGFGIWLYGDQNRGTFGDMFGAPNALFSGLAFAGVIYAILLQREDLRLQTRELELSREELAGQREQLAEQVKNIRQQNFENTFFQLLRLHTDIVGAIDLWTQNKTTVGRDCFRVFYQRLHEFQIEAAKDPGFKKLPVLEQINAFYLEFYKREQAEIGHYFRSLYNIVKFVDQSSVSDKRLYTNLIRAQLSSFELTLLFYNCASDMGRVKFKPLVEKYSLLKTVPEDRLFTKEHLSLYEPSAYGNA